MSTQFILTAAGYIVGGFFGYPQAGALVGSLLGAAVQRPDRIAGPKLPDLSAPKLSYGSTIPRLYGRYRVTGTPIWASALQEHEQTQEVGGKGGGQEVTTTTYTIDMLLLCAIDTQAAGISRVWLNKKLIYNIGPDATDDAIAASIGSNKWSSITLLDGNATQDPWSVYEAAVGIGNAPAYRHRTTVGIAGLDLGNSGIPPLIEIELFTVGSSTAGAYVDNFADGLTPYSEDTPGDKAYFNDDALELGPCIGPRAVAPGGPYRIISRSITDTVCARMSLWMRLGSVLGAGDSGAFVLKQGATQKVVVVPARETAIDATRAAHVVVLGEDQAISLLDLLTWYRLDVAIVAGAGNSTAKLYDANGTLLSTTTFSGNFSPPTIDTIELQCEGAPGAGASEFSRLRISGGSTTISPVDLADIVSAECQRAGLATSQFDATALVGIDVDGFAAQNGARDTLQELAAVYYFDCHCTDKLYFLRRGGSSAVTVPFADTGAGMNVQGEAFNGMDRADDLTIPAFFTVQAPDVTRDYEPGSVMSDRLVTQSREVRAFQTAVVMSPSDMKGRADSFAGDARAGSHTGVANLDLAYIQHTPTDIVTLTDADGTTYRSRIMRQTFADSVLRCEVALDDANALVDTGIAPPDGTPSISVDSPGLTYIELVDGPILRDDDDDAGLYGAVRFVSGTGSGSRVAKSIDGTTFATVADVTSQAVGGQASTALGSVSNPYLWDEVNIVTVTASGTLSSSTTAAMQADPTINVIALQSGSGWEYLRFRTATLVSTGVYTLSGLIRGIRGTESFIAGHAAGDRFVKLGVSGMLRLPGSGVEVGATRYYRAVTLGSDAAEAGVISFANSAVGLKPFSPVRLRAERDTSGNVTFTFNRRTRLGVRYGGSGGSLAPLGEDTESYQIDIYSGVSVVRTLSGTSESIAYSAADQTTDFGSAQSAIDAEVFQISATVGRGFGHRATV